MHAWTETLQAPLRSSRKIRSTPPALAASPIGVLALLSIPTRRSALTVQDHLLSLRLLSLQGRALRFRLAFLSWRRKDLTTAWTGTVRGARLEELGLLEGELALAGETLDGRSVAGRALVRRPRGPADEIEIEGCGPLVVSGRAL